MKAILSYNVIYCKSLLLSLWKPYTVIYCKSLIVFMKAILSLLLRGFSSCGACLLSGWRTNPQSVISGQANCSKPEGPHYWTSWSTCQHGAGFNFHFHFFHECLQDVRNIFFLLSFLALPLSLPHTHMHTHTEQFGICEMPRPAEQLYQGEKKLKSNIRVKTQI